MESSGKKAFLTESLLHLSKVFLGPTSQVSDYDIPVWCSDPSDMQYNELHNYCISKITEMSLDSVVDVADPIFCLW